MLAEALETFIKYFSNTIVFDHYDNNVGVGNTSIIITVLEMRKLRLRNAKPNNIASKLKSQTLNQDLITLFFSLQHTSSGGV